MIIFCQLQQISWTSVLVNLTPHMGHLRLRLAVVSSIHLRQKMCGHVLRTTYRSRSPLQVHITLRLYSSNSIRSISDSDFSSICFNFKLIRVTYALVFSFSMFIRSIVRICSSIYLFNNSIVRSFSLSCNTHSSCLRCYCY